MYATDFRDTFHNIGGDVPNNGQWTKNRSPRKCCPRMIPSRTGASPTSSILREPNGSSVSGCQSGRSMARRWPRVSRRLVARFFHRYFPVCDAEAQSQEPSDVVGGPRKISDFEVPRRRFLPRIPPNSAWKGRRTRLACSPQNGNSDPVETGIDSGSLSGESIFCGVVPARPAVRDALASRKCVPIKPQRQERCRLPVVHRRRLDRAALILS